MFLNVEQTVALLKSGGVAAIPTETVYGLAGSIHSAEAIQSLFETKQRPFFDPLIVHIASRQTLPQITRQWGEAAQVLAERFWPGPLTLVVPKHPNLNPMITSGLDTVGIRWPKHSLAQEVIFRVGAPLAAPSANIFTRTSPTTAQHVEDEFQGRVGVLDGGPCEVGLESTVVHIEETSSLIRAHILRPGYITREKIQAALKYSTNKSVIVDVGESAQSPGHMKEHYRPKVPLILIQQPLENLEEVLRKHFPDYKKYVELVLPEKPELAARVLYGEMRRLAEQADLIIVKIPSHRNDELWSTIINRLEKASSLSL